MAQATHNRFLLIIDNHSIHGGTDSTIVFLMTFVTQNCVCSDQVFFFPLQMSGLLD